MRLKDWKDTSPAGRTSRNFLRTDLKPRHPWQPVTQTWIQPTYSPEVSASSAEKPVDMTVLLMRMPGPVQRSRMRLNLLQNGVMNFATRIPFCSTIRTSSVSSPPVVSRMRR